MDHAGPRCRFVAPRTGQDTTPSVVTARRRIRCASGLLWASGGCHAVIARACLAFNPTGRWRATYGRLTASTRRSVAVDVDCGVSSLFSARASNTPVSSRRAVERGAGSVTWSMSRMGTVGLPPGMPRRTGKTVTAARGSVARRQVPVEVAIQVGVQEDHTVRAVRASAGALGVG